MAKKICPRCHGNGYIKVKESIENSTEIIHQCTMCKSQGELMIDKERLELILNKNNTSISTERLVLDSKLVKELNNIIKKLNDEVDMLSKQKIYLQSKLREKEQNDTRR